MARSKQPAHSAKNTFEALLKKVKREEYQEFIRQYASKNTDFKTEFEVYFSAKDARIDVGQKYTTLIKKLIRRYSDRGFVDYRASFGLAQEVEQLVRTGYELADQKNFQDAFLLVQPALKEMMEVITACDDSSGSIGGSIHYIIRLIATVAEADQAAPALKEKVFAFLQSELSDKLYFDYGDFGYDLFTIYQTLAVSRGKSSEFLGFIDAQTIRLTGPYDSYRREFFLKQKIDFLKMTGKPEEVRQLIAQHLDIVEVRQGEVDKAIETEDFARAKNLIADGIKVAEDKEHPGTVAKWKKELLRIAELENDTETVRHYTRHFACDRGFDKTYYHQWKKTYPTAEWEDVIEDFITKRIKKVTQQHKATKRKGWGPSHPPLLYALAPVYIEEQYWDRLLALIQQENNLTNTLQYHSYLVKQYPAELLAIYLPAFERMGEQVNGRKEYADLARKMKKVMKDIPEGKEKIRAIVQQLKEKYPRRPAMLDELNKVLA